MYSLDRVLLPRVLKINMVSIQNKLFQPLKARPLYSSKSASFAIIFCVEVFLLGVLIFYT
jgi:hypothetical protein